MLKECIAQSGVLIFDLDKTLYQDTNGFFEQIITKVREFLIKFHQVDAEKAEAIRVYYNQQYGTTLHGLIAEHEVDPHDFLEEVHAVDRSLIQPDLELDRLLSLQPQEKIVFTNGPIHHAEAVLDILQIRRHFSLIFDIIAADFKSKPHTPTYLKLCKKARIEPKKAIFFEDTAVNLLPAADLGMTTVLIETKFETKCDAHAEHGNDKRIHYRITSVKEAF